MGRRKRAKRAEEAGSDGGGPPPAARRGPRKADAILWAIVVLVLGVPVALVLLGRVGDGSPAGPPTAAIVDQLSLTYPNPEFAETATDMLERNGYAVDYYPGEAVSVEFFRDLPERDYDLIIFRNHSGLITQTGWSATAIFTSEPYSREKYVEEQGAKQLATARPYDGGPEVFAIEPAFIESRMRGSFDDATIILMGCHGLGNDKAAEAFLKRGAKSFVSWDWLVTPSHTDRATQVLLRELAQDVPVEEAVATTMAEVGPDPSFGAELRFMSR